MIKHIGYPLPSEMFHPHLYCWAMPEDEVASRLLDIPLKCRVCGKIINEKDMETMGKSPRRERGSN